jgi:putative hydrolase of the HAD superfamily
MGGHSPASTGHNSSVTTLWTSSRGTDRRKRQTLVFDADDTLWENNVYFKRVVDDYLDWVAHPTLDRDQIRAILNDIESVNIGTHGYGTTAFLHNLAECLERLRERPTNKSERMQIQELANDLIHHQIELMPGVAEALTDLATRHELLLVTKGAPDEQQRKIDASGLAGHFSAVHIVAEKDAHTYRRLFAHHELRAETTWMIGNSPKSDILAARAAGLNAVFIPHRYTWELEQSELDPEDRHVLVLESFPELLEHF